MLQSENVYSATACPFTVCSKSNKDDLANSSNETGNEQHPPEYSLTDYAVDGSITGDAMDQPIVIDSECMSVSGG